ncbi:extracellular solute-binding protein [Micromonospora endophytica]|uniref:ABC transporter substrate-binding protein n=1 Tax=Micromonospora endophytica TaxID=515350 RepID=A0A2W2CQ97_9ACTN|nr:extracellular solute-binding protein [Micromonospora endophytica]PZG00743.1 ABC transporter substrate-binding protein [Micromonospora endophytica]RIW44864.1 extracellular solute-binding protein [Micromonospora endophytica]
MTDNRLNRRRFLTMAGGAAVTLAGGGALAGCGDATSTSAPDGAKSAVLPDYVPSQLVRPDLPPTPEGVMAGYYRYPRQLVDAFDVKPAAGLGDVRILTNMFNPVPPAAGSNQYWQELNNRVGANLDITMTPSADYLNKLSTTIASGDLPDIMLISARLARRADVLTRLCADLSEFLSGPAAANFPFLANIPRDSWLSTAYGGGIFAVPISRSVVGTIMFGRTDLIAQRSLNPTPGSYAEFVELARGLTDARANRWAFGSAKGVITFVGNMLGVPNAWREEGGRFVSEVETPQRKEAVARVAEMYQAGLFHPDAIGGRLQLRDLFGNGTIALNSDGYAAWDILADTYPVQVGGIPAPGYDGGTPVHRSGTPTFALTAFRKTEKDRLEKLLRLADWLAAPLGTSEYMFRKFGVEGRHYTWQDDVPVRTDLGNVEVKLPLEYVAESPHVLGPAERTRVDAQRAYQEKVVPNLLRNPTEGLNSETSVSKSGELLKIIDTAELDIVAGRKPISAWDDAVAQWKAAGGDQIRGEYEKALADQQ